MPSFLISHQAPAFLIKLKYPKKIDLVAICIGTIIPDLNLFSSILNRNFTHSFIGIIIVTVPLTIFLSIMFIKYLSPLISWISVQKYFILKPLRFFGLDDLKYLKLQLNKKFFLIASYSALLGGLAHILLDMPSHPHIQFFYPIIIEVPILIENINLYFGSITIFNIQITFEIMLYSLIRRIWDLVLIPITLYFLRYIKKHNLIQKWNSYDEAIH
ncbi:MAG: DUF4184 family protein [Candidatus Lokiarchaeota archaeon]|nr:DUF4184 family protein [Candidatus Lokiarchaeota archaeon]